MSSHLIKKEIASITDYKPNNFSVRRKSYWWQTRVPYSISRHQIDKIGKHLYQTRAKTGLKILKFDNYYFLNIKLKSRLLFSIGAETDYQEQEKSYKFLPDYKDLRTNIDIQPEKDDTKLVLADYCEENSGDEEAEFWRWAAKYHIHPFNNLMWMYSYRSSSGHTLSMNLFRKLHHERFSIPGSAYDALMLAWSCK